MMLERILVLVLVGVLELTIQRHIRVGLAQTHPEDGTVGVLAGTRRGATGEDGAQDGVGDGALDGVLAAVAVAVRVERWLGPVDEADGSGVDAARRDGAYDAVGPVTARGCLGRHDVLARGRAAGSSDGLRHKARRRRTCLLWTTAVTEARLSYLTKRRMRSVGGVGDYTTGSCNRYADIAVWISDAVDETTATTATATARNAIVVVSTTNTLSKRACLTLNLIVTMMARAHTWDLINSTSFGMANLSLTHRRTAAVAARVNGLLS